VASVIGREFALDILRGVANISEDVFDNALKEAVQMSVLEERSQLGSIRYRFTHAFFRQTMYEELIAPQRLKLHQQVARSLETQYAKRLEEHAAELAEHFSQSTDAADLAKAVSYGEMAAQRAVSVYAYGEAVRLLEQALKVQKVLDPDDKAKVCDLLLALADYVSMAGDMKRAFTVELEEAFLIAEGIDDKARAARACSLAMPNIALNGAAIASWITPEAAKWVDRADLYAEPSTPARIWADIGVGELKCEAGIQAGRFDLSNEGRRVIIRNLDLARKAGDPESFWFAAASRSLQGSAPHHAAARLKLAEELALKSRAGVSTRMYSLASGTIAQIFLESGQRRRAEEFFNQVKEMAERSEQAVLVIHSMQIESALATLDGKLEQAVDIAEAMRALGEQLGPAQWASILSLIASFTALLHLGRYDEISSLSKRILGPADLFVRLIIGPDSEAAGILDRFVMMRPGIGSIDDETPVFIDLYLLQAAVRIKHSPSAELLLSRYTGDYMPTSGIIIPTCIPRHLGSAAALLGRFDQARKYYNEAVKITTEMRFRPELALTRLQFAELLLDHYPAEKADAFDHLDFAIKEFRDMKMQPSLERALKLHSEWTEK
jgi:tetratricopeptide (TPR) repeat protein